MNTPLSTSERRELQTLRSYQKSAMLKEAWLAGGNIEETFDVVTAEPRRRLAQLELGEVREDSDQ